MNVSIAYTTRFMKTFLNLKSKEQELVDKAINAWRENPENSSSNFEKLKYAGSNIYSIRANTEWRIIMAKLDGVYFLLHTGGEHDKTNDWAKNKRIDRNIITGAIQLVSINIEEVHHQIEKQETPDDNEGVFEGFEADELLLLGVPDEWIDTVKKVKNEEQFMNLWDVLPEDCLENLEMLWEGNVNPKVLIAQIRNEIEKKPKAIEEQIKIQPGFYVIGEDQALIDVLNQDISVFRLYLHPSQYHLAYSNFSGSKKITGTAGTGKTVVGLHRAKFLANHLKDGDKPVFFTTFTKFLIKNLKALFNEEEIPQSKLQVQHIHKFAEEYAKKLKLIPQFIKREPSNKAWRMFLKKHPEIGLDAKFLEEEYKQVVLKFHVCSEEEYMRVARTGRGSRLFEKDRKKVWDIFKKYELYQKHSKVYTFNDIVFQLNKYLEVRSEFKPFKHIICDEVQDFGNLELRLIRNLAEKGPNDLLLVGDPFQNIYSKKIVFNKSGIEIRGRSSRLKLNYRTTEEIRRTASKMLEAYQYEDFTGVIASDKGDKSILNGNPPNYHVFATRNEELEFLVEYIKESFGEVNLHAICIGARTKQAVEEIYEFIKDSKLPVKKLKDLDDMSQLDGHVGVSTLHGMKGLEFKNVIITGLSKKSFPMRIWRYKNWDEERRHEYLKSEHALYYVAFSRAISDLVITGVGEKLDLVAGNIHGNEN